MSRFECAGTDACQIYCDALKAHGVAVEIGDGARDCNVPDMFTVNDEAVSFSPKENQTGIKIPDLVGELGGRLCQVLVEHAQDSPEQAKVNELISVYQDKLDARFTLWQGMLGATRDRRKFTDVELAYYQREAGKAEAIARESSKGASADTVIRARAAVGHATLEDHGILFDEQMIRAIDRATGNLMDGKPFLLVGDKGIAKTQVGKFVARLWEKQEPVIISGHGDMMSNELVGQMEQDKETRVFAFKEGKLVQAMREGRPVILDEINLGDQSVVMRLQDILLRRPGDQVLLQENGKEPIEIQPGFVVFATANEASARYQHRNILDPAHRDRYDVWLLHYPDHETTNPLTTVPESLMLLGLSAAVDRQGNISRHINAAELEKLVRLAHVTQHLYSVPASNVRAPGLVPAGQATSALIDAEPLMSDCITPRALHEIVERCADGNKPGMTLKSETARATRSLDQAGSTRNQTIANKALTMLNTAAPATPAA